MQGLKLSASKVSYALSNGLGQHFHKDVVKDIQDAPTVSLGTDGSTFNFNMQENSKVLYI